MDRAKFFAALRSRDCGLFLTHLAYVRSGCDLGR